MNPNGRIFLWRARWRLALHVLSGNYNGPWTFTDLLLDRTMRQNTQLNKENEDLKKALDKAYADLAATKEPYR